MQGARPPVPSPGTGPRQPTPQRPMADPTRPPSRGGVRQVGVQPHRVMGCLRQDALPCEEVIGMLAKAGRGQDDVRVTYVRREGDAQPGQHVIGRLVSVRLVQLVQVDPPDAQPVQDEDTPSGDGPVPASRRRSTRCFGPSPKAQSRAPGPRRSTSRRWRADPGARGPARRSGPRRRGGGTPRAGRGCRPAGLHRLLPSRDHGRTSTAADARVPAPTAIS